MSQEIQNSNTATLGARIRTARKAAGMTIAHLAEIMGVSVAAVQQWEADKTTPTVDRLLKLTELLGGGILVNPSEVQAGDDVAVWASVQSIDDGVIHVTFRGHKLIASISDLAFHRPQEKFTVGQRVLARGKPGSVKAISSEGDKAYYWVAHERGCKPNTYTSSELVPALIEDQ